jgi:phospholipid N-methyltransferase
MWTPSRVDLLLELCGEIGDEDTSLVDRAEARAERFEEYSDKRAGDADLARNAVAAIADNIPFGQPILVGHHSERRARKDAERIENGMRRAVRMWETSAYWKQRAAGALCHAKYKELPAVRHRRIKGLEADKRKQERSIAESERLLADWRCEGLTLARAMGIANYDRISRCFSLADFPRNPPASQYEGMMSLWSALDGGVIDEQQARDIAIPAHVGRIAWARRWLEHFDNRIAYERAMLGEQGGLKAEKFDIQPGGRVLVRGEWVVVLRVNKQGGQINSVTTNARFVRVRSIEEIEDYRAPTEEEAATVKKICKLPPLVNFPGEGFLEMTAEEWKKKHKDYKRTRVAPASAEHGAYRFRTAIVSGSGYRSAQVYITDAKRVDPPAPVEAVEPLGVEIMREAVPQRAPAAVAETGGEGAAKAADFEAMREQLKTGVQVVSAPQLFPTPAGLAARMVELAGLAPGQAVLEPSAGTGNILRAIREATGGGVVRTAIEINARLCDRLRVVEAGASVINCDFLEYLPVAVDNEKAEVTQGRFDRILMNPPFENAQDIKQIKHALRMLKPGGRLVAICANGPRQNAQLRPLVEQCGGEWENLPPDTFRESGTGVNAALLTLTA